MSPDRIMFIRHAEKPTDAAPDGGITAEGKPDKESLTTRGWQRAGALVRFFCPVSKKQDLVPRTIFASATGKDSKSDRPAETIAPLAEFLEENGGVNQRLTHAKGDLDALVADIEASTGRVLVAWEHKRIPDIIQLLSNPPSGVPSSWPDDRFDVVWILDRKDKGWSFSQLPQLLLAGDSDHLIS